MTRLFHYRCPDCEVEFKWTVHQVAYFAVRNVGVVCPECEEPRVYRTQPTMLEHVITSAKLGRLLTTAEMQELYDHHRVTGEIMFEGKVIS